VLPRAEIRLDCAPGSTDTSGLCSREHRYFWIVLPGAHVSLDCAPGSTRVAGLCSQEHKYRWIVLPGAQVSLDCAPGSTNIAGLCSREHKYGCIVLPGAQSRHYCARASPYVLPGDQLRLEGASPRRAITRGGQAASSSALRFGAPNQDGDTGWRMSCNTHECWTPWVECHACHGVRCV